MKELRKWESERCRLFLLDREGFKGSLSLYIYIYLFFVFNLFHFFVIFFSGDQL